MSGLFENLSANDDQARVAGRKAVAVARKRVEDRFGEFLRAASSKEDFRARLALVEDDLNEAIADVADEHGGDFERIQSTIQKVFAGWENLERGPDGRWQQPSSGGETTIDDELAEAPSAVGESTGDLGGDPVTAKVGRWTIAADDDDEDDKDDDKDKGDKDDDDDGDDDKKNLPPWLKDKESRTADADRDGGGAVKREDLPKGDESALGGPSPKIDKGNSGDERGWSLKAIDTETSGTPHPTVEQDVTDPADYKNRDFHEQIDAVNESQDLPSAGDEGQSTERNIKQPSDAADQWTGTEGQTDPITTDSDAVLAAVDPEKNPVRDVLEADYEGFVPQTTVESAIRKFESTPEAGGE